MDNIQAVTSAFYASLSKKSQMAVLLTDFTKAFDSLHHSYLFKVLKKMDFPPFFINLVRGLLTEVGIIPICCPGREVVIPVGQGVKQGCPLSPALFIIAIDPLLFLLEKAGITSKGFFDDVAVLSDRPADIERALKLFQDFGDVSGLALNPQKTVLLTSLRPCHWIVGWRDEIKEWLPGATSGSLPLVEKATYLGALLGRKVTAEEIFSNTLDKARARLHLYHPYREKLSVPKRVVVVNAFILPIFGYLGRLFVIPGPTLRAINSAIAKFVVPASFFKVSLLQRPTRRMGLKTPLHNLELRNLALILSRRAFPGAQPPECSHPLHPSAQHFAAENRALAFHPGLLPILSHLQGPS